VIRLISRMNQHAKRNDLKKAWERSWQDQMSHLSKTKFANIFVYLLSIAGNLLLTFGCWVWWRPDVALGDGLIIASTSLLVHLVMTYETGYKKFFRVGDRQYFYIVWLIPMLLSVVGLVGGFFYRGIV